MSLYILRKFWVNALVCGYFSQAANDVLDILITRLKSLHNYLVVEKALTRKVGCIFIFVFLLKISILTQGIWNQSNKYIN